MNFIPVTWVFNLKPVDSEGNEMFHKERCFVRGEYLKDDVGYDLFGTYAPVASNEEIRTLRIIAAHKNVIV